MNEYCSHIGIMSAGRMVQLGTVSQIAAHHDDSRCRYEVMLASSVANLANIIGSIEGVSNVEVNHTSFNLEYSADRADAARLLSELIAHRLPVASFTAKAPDLEAAYLRFGIRQVD
jgi:ABC-type uncharacterized transport system ATPase subunit